MKHYIPILLLFAFVFNGCTNTPPKEEAPKGDVFPNVEYSTAIAYHFEDLKGGYIINKKGELNPTVKKQKKLNHEEIDLFLKTINSNDSYGGIYTRCFKPRLGVVFYDNAQKPLAHISICFECNQQMSSPLIKAHSEAELGNHGYTEQGFRNLTSFCRKLGFGQCGE